MSGFRIDATLGAKDGETAAEFYRALVLLCNERGVTLCEFRSQPAAGAEGFGRRKGRRRVSPLFNERNEP